MSGAGQHEIRGNMRKRTFIEENHFGVTAREQNLIPFKRPFCFFTIFSEEKGYFSKHAYSFSGAGLED